MKKKSSSLIITCLSVAVAVCFLVGTKVEARGGGNPNPQPVVFVTGQGLYYDSVVSAKELPPIGSFQVLVEDCAQGPLCTEFGPGDAGYLGGRWVVNPGPSAVYFSCPLLGPGRETP